MDMHRMVNRGIGVLLVVALASTLLAPAAQAGRRVDRTYGGARVLRHGPVLAERNSAAGAIVGFIGGMVLGAILANASQATPARECYDDSYDRDGGDRYGRYDEPVYYRRYPRAVSARDGYCRRGDEPCRRYEERERYQDRRGARARIGGDRMPVGDDQVPVGDGRDAPPPYEEWDD